MRYDNAKPTQEDAMIATIVQFALPAPISLAEATRRFESSAPKYQNLAGLVRKYYVRSEDGRSAGGIYLWETRAAAEAVYNTEWRERVEKLYGATPTITWFDSPVIVDNLAGTISKAA
jgi:Putative mono-oxygenase ydhR